MEKSAVIILCIMVTCSVWAVDGRSFEVAIDDQEQEEVEVEVDISVQAGKIPGVCWACKWALNKVKKSIGSNASAESIKSKLSAVCDQIGLLKSVCRKFVQKHLGELIEELTTTDDVRTICVNIKACKPKELSHLIFYPRDENSLIEMTEYAP
ncbi:hypothetical protein INR49_019919 [Caranx melampygus]|nr:hypothetical protein INR49_019919 [Caranx melampygus]